MKKFCVFCGKKPDKKNKEHIIPKWLIKLTGDENRTISLGINFNEIFSEGEPDIKNRFFSFKSFQFPACSSCNLKYSEFENQASTIVKKILKEEFISSGEFNHLLDWFDKVRIGLWLGSITLDKVKEEINPKFYINNRIGKKDRALYVYKLEKIQDGVNFHGFNTPGFQTAPCVCGFRINNFYFISYSKENLTSENLGFPYLEHIDYDQNSRGEIFEPQKGHNKIKIPIINENFFRPTMSFYQSILDLDQTPVEYVNDYVRKNILKDMPERSIIFYYDSSDKKIKKFDEDIEIIIDGKVINQEIEKFNNIITKNVINELEKLLKFNHHMKIENKEKASIIENNRKNILTFHKAVKKVMFELM